MSWGLKAINDDSYVLIDSDTPRLCAIHNGTYGNSGQRYVNVYFPTAVTTPEPPCIFIQNAQAAGAMVYDSLSLFGSAGNWTGFQLSANNVDNRPFGKWFCAVFAVQAQAEYGLRMWGADGGVIFDSGTTPVIVTRATNSLAYLGNINNPPLGSRNMYAFNLPRLPLKSDEYFMVNPFSRPVPHSPAPKSTGIYWDWGNHALTFMVFGSTGNPPYIDQGSPGAVFARLPGT